MTTGTIDAQHGNSLLAGSERLPADAPQWFIDRRTAAAAHFRTLGIPTSRDEAWRFTNVSRLGDQPLEPAWQTPGSVDLSSLGHALLDGTSTHRVILVDGIFDADLSSNGSLPDGVRVGALGAATDPAIEANLAQHARADIEPFVALNTACLQDGAFCIVPDGVTLDRPIEIVHVSTTGSRVSHPRTLVVAGKNAACTVIETFVGTTHESYFTNAVTEIVADDKAVVDHYKVGLESDAATHIGTVQIYQKSETNVGSKVVTFGGALVRNNMNTVLDGEHCNCDLRGLSIIDGDRLVDNNLRVNHDKPNCDSRELFKNILDDRARAVFTGRIYVAEDAQKTDAKQTSMSLLLSDDAQANANPQLEIFADDVKCTHGATIGELDPEAMFYLRTRGLSTEAARSMLIYAFANESLEEIRVEPLRTKLERMLVDKLPGSAVLKTLA